MTQLLTGREMENVRDLAGLGKPKVNISTKCYLTAILIILVLILVLGTVIYFSL